MSAFAKPEPTIMDDHDALIDSLSREARPVKRPPAPAVRAAIWVALALPCGAAVGLWLSRRFFNWSVPEAAWAVAGLVAAFALGAIAILSAFNLTIAGRKPIGWPSAPSGWLRALLACPRPPNRGATSAAGLAVISSW